MKKFVLLFSLLQLNFINSQIDAGDGIYTVATCNFDSPCADLRIDTASNNLWKIGNPHKIIFNSNGGANKVMITDTINNYLVNNHSKFIFKSEFNYLEGFNFIISFKHRFDTDTLKDGGYVELSIDNGQTWYNVIDSNMPFQYQYAQSENFYTSSDSLIDSKVGFSGYSSDWIVSRFQWLISFPLKKDVNDTLLFRFNFISDSIDDGREGWIIDDFEIQMAHFSGLKEENLHINAMIVPNPNSGTFNIELNKNIAIQELKLLDEIGRTVQLLDAKSKSFQLNLPKGLYFLEFTSDKHRFLEKMMVN